MAKAEVTLILRVGGINSLKLSLWFARFLPYLKKDGASLKVANWGLSRLRYKVKGDDWHPLTTQRFESA